MREPSKDSIDDYLRPNIIMCSTVGMWFLDETCTIGDRLFSYCRWMISFVAVTSIFVPQIMMIAIAWGDLRILAGAGSIVTTLGQYIFRIIYLTAKKNETYRLYTELKSLWNASDDPRERHSYVQLAYWARKCTVIFFLSAVWTVLSFVIPTALDYFKAVLINDGANATRHLPFDGWYGMDITASPYFEILFVCQFLAGMICAAGICGLDMSCVTAILHVTGQFKLIKVWLRQIGTEMNCRSTDRPHNCLLKLERNLNRCIRHHQRVVRAVNDVNNILTPIIFLQLLFSGILICLIGFAVISKVTTTELFEFLIYLMAMILQLLLWCFPGEILVQESQATGYTAYQNIPWYRLPSMYQKHLFLVIVRSQKYCGISAFTFQMLSYHTLTEVFNTAASFFTLLRQIQEK